MRSKPPARSLALLLALLIAGCGYGEVSPTAYRYAQAVYNISGQKAAGRVAALREQIGLSLEAQELSAQEADWLTDLADRCDAGRWEEARRAARRMMQDQVKR